MVGKAHAAQSGSEGLLQKTAQNSSDPVGPLITISPGIAGRQPGLSLFIRSYLEKSRAIWTKPEELRVKFAASARLPLINRTLPEVTQFLVAFWIEAIADHGLPPLELLRLR